MASSAHARAQEKIDQVLAFLASEPFSTRDHIAELLGLKWPNKAHELLRRMQKAGLVCQRRVKDLTAWYIKGQNPGSVVNVEHFLFIQLAGIRALKAGWTDWQREGHGLGEKGAAWCDATVRDPQGRLVWIECERTLKNNYAGYIINRVRARESKGWNVCMFIAPTPELSAAVRRAIDKVTDERFDLDGERTRLSIPTLHRWFPTRFIGNAYRASQIPVSEPPDDPAKMPIILDEYPVASGILLH